MQYHLYSIQYLLKKTSNNNVQAINEVVDAYFIANPEVDCFAANKLMPLLVEKGVFNVDKKNGLPLRQVLREMDKNKELESLPRLFAERIEPNVFWYFLREGAEFKSNHIPAEPNAKQKRAEELLNSDEVYLLDLIDSALNQTGSRKHTFSFLLGDLHKDGESRTELPLDSYYRELRLAIEIVQHPEVINNSPRSQKLTISGITRAEQRLRYAKRKGIVLKQNDIAFLEISLIKFEVNEENRLVRDSKKDMKVLNVLLKEFI